MWKKNKTNILIEPTPNPNALKFVLDTEVIDRGKASFNDISECDHIPLVRDIISIEGVLQVHLFENVISVTKSDLEWDDLTPKIESVIVTRLPSHDINFNQKQEEQQVKKRENLPLEIRQIEDILDDTVRIGLRADGGDIEVLELEDNRLYVKYEGACGTCPSATTGTLYVIEAILKDRFNPEIEVIAV